MISEIRQLICTIKTYKNKPINNELEKTLSQLIDSIEELLDNNVRSNDITSIEKFENEIIENYKNDHIKKAFYCNECNAYFLNETNNIDEHIKNDIENSLINRNDDSSDTESDESEFISLAGSQSENDMTNKNCILGEMRHNLKYEDRHCVNSLKEAYTECVPYKKELEKQMNIFNSIRDDLLKIISPKFPQSKICIYGSRLTCLTNNKNANLNLFIDTGHYFTSFGTNKEVIVKLLNTIRGEISKTNYFIVKIQEDIYNNRILIVKHKKYNFDCYLSVTNGIILYYQSSLLTYLFQENLYQNVCKLINNLIGHIFNSYQIGLLVVFYYQIKYKLPPISCLQDKNIVIASGPWQVNFQSHSLKGLGYKVSKNNFQNCLSDIKGFFNYYSNFDYDNTIICPFLGKSVNKKDLLYIKLTMERYFGYLTVDPVKNRLNSETPMCIQDPIVHNINITAEISKKDLERFKWLKIK